jgi:hypothetical protein
MTNLQICRTYTLAAVASQGPEFEIRGSCVGGPGFNSQMNRFSQISQILIKQLQDGCGGS